VDKDTVETLDVGPILATQRHDHDIVTAASKPGSYLADNGFDSSAEMRRVIVSGERDPHLRHGWLAV
jgi:hypothetical protein